MKDDDDQHQIRRDDKYEKDDVAGVQCGRVRELTDWERG